MEIAEGAMSDSPRTFQLPESFIGTGDPQDSNPFPPSDPRHNVWTEATRVAEEEVCRIGVQPLERPKNYEGLRQPDVRQNGHRSLSDSLWGRNSRPRDRDSRAFTVA